MNLPWPGNAYLHYNANMTVTVTSRGQITFRKELLQHLGVRPGGKIAVDKLPNGRVALRAARPTGSISDFIGSLAGKTKKVATLAEIQKAAADGWAGRI
jgi:bifunctional DNA-binding transcriptional regulator/antitoxin component of YhaV-PrlF toxin-antitoxin module